MNKIQLFLYFLIGCVGARLLIVMIAKEINKKYLKYLGYLALVPAIGFMYLYLSGARKGLGAFGEKIWWNHLRPVHSILYFLFAYNAIIGNKQAWIYLLIDVTISLISFLIEHYVNGDFKLLFKK
jgi:drug/metabolite transporter (DMT)-like permease